MAAHSCSNHAFTGIAHALDLTEHKLPFDRHCCHAGGWEVKFLDLDWAGVDGTARYPLPMNEDKLWPSSAGYLQLITREHDLWQVEHAFTHIYMAG